MFFKKDKRNLDALAIICKELTPNCSYVYVMGMIKFAAAYGAITAEQEAQLITHLNEIMKKRG